MDTGGAPEAPREEGSRRKLTGHAGTSVDQPTAATGPSAACPLSHTTSSPPWKENKVVESFFFNPTQSALSKEQECHRNLDHVGCRQTHRSFVG
mmetsp:Transcript_16586/g.33987  ORF Transcript_16586/g.33987 Transcript_16586/m.33987 type:complete len:94 (-) Transcript_16586:481-762(-)